MLADCLESGFLALDPSGDAVGEVHVDGLGVRLSVLEETELEADLLLERIGGLLLDFNGDALAEIIFNGRRSVKGGHGLALTVFHPHAGNVVREITVQVADTAFGLVDRTVLHPGQAVFEGIVVRIAGGDELVGAGEVLHGLEVLRYGSETAVEDSFLYPVSPLAVSGDHQIVAHGPGVVGDVAGLMARKGIVSCQGLRG